MLPPRSLARKKNLLLAFDAFDTLYKPNIRIPVAYALAAKRHGIDCVPDTAISKPPEKWEKKEYESVKQAFGRAYKDESVKNPNFGKATGLGADKWWANIIRGTFQQFLKPQQEVPEALVSELLERYASDKGYDLFPDVAAFFHMLKSSRLQRELDPPWKWEKTVVGIITNSDYRVPSILSSFGLKIGPRRVGTPDQRTSEATVTDDISFVALSYDVGYMKPDRHIFDAATDMLKETLAETASSAGPQSIDDYERLYVGDSLEEDYVGAELAGWHAVLLNRQQDRKDNRQRRTDGLRNVPLNKKRVTLANGQTKIIKSVDGLAGLAKWSPEEI